MDRKDYLLLSGTLFAAVALIAIGAKKGKKNQQANNNGGTDMYDKTNWPRGYRNNNPLNIRISNSQWQGEVANNTDGVFEQFVTMEYGYRAALKLIQNYINLYGLNTVAKIIGRWAPDNENDTKRYISTVCAQNNWSANKVIDPNNMQDMADLVYAMAIVENGYSILPNYTEIYKGWSML